MASRLIFLSLLFCSLTWAIETIEELDEMALFSFSLISDNKGDHPDGNNAQSMSRVDNWISNNSEFVLGLGDHTKGSSNGFLNWIGSDSYWKSNFYPNVADGENETFGSGQGDWGAGWEIFEHVDDFFNRDNVNFRSNDRVDYYAHFEVGEINIHVLSLHYSDSAPLKEVSRAFMEAKLIELAETKTENDIILILAHSRGDLFNNADFSVERRDLMFNTADFICDASSHIFHRHDNYDSEYPEGAVWFNSGSTSNTGSTHGYVEFHVLQNPTRLTVQYINVEQRSSRELHVGHITKMESFIDDATTVPYVKEIMGPHEPVDWSTLESIPIATQKGNLTHQFHSDDIVVSSFGSLRTVEFFNSRRSDVNLSLFNSQGKLVKTLYNKTALAGNHSIKFDTTPFESGVYYLQGFAGQNKLIKTLAIID